MRYKSIELIERIKNCVVALENEDEDLFTKKSILISIVNYNLSNLKNKFLGC